MYFPNLLLGDQRETIGDLLDRCQDCRLHLKNQKYIKGQLIHMGEDYLEIAVREAPVTKQFQHLSHQEVIPIEDVLDMQCGDPSWDGIIWGCLAGGLVGATYLGLKYNFHTEQVYEHDYTTSGKALKGFLIGGGIGAILGYLIDVDTGYSQETKSIQEWLGEGE